MECNEHPKCRHEPGMTTTEFATPDVSRGLTTLSLTDKGHPRQLL